MIGCDLFRREDAVQCNANKSNLIICNNTFRRYQYLTNIISHIAPREKTHYIYMLWRSVTFLPLMTTNIRLKFVNIYIYI